MLELCQNWIFGQKIDFSNSVKKKLEFGLKSGNCIHKRHLAKKPNLMIFSQWKLSLTCLWCQAKQTKVTKTCENYLIVIYPSLGISFCSFCYLCSNNYAGVQKSVRQAAFFSLNMLLHIYHVTSALGKLNIVGIGRNLLAITLPSHGN